MAVDVERFRWSLRCRTSWYGGGLCDCCLCLCSRFVGISGHEADTTSKDQGDDDGEKREAEKQNRVHFRRTSLDDGNKQHGDDNGDVAETPTNSRWLLPDSQQKQEALETSTRSSVVDQSKEQK